MLLHFPVKQGRGTDPPYFLPGNSGTQRIFRESPETMPQRSSMKLRSLVIFAATALLMTSPIAAQELRFSVMLGAPDRSAAGFGKLTSDQIAVIDALVRRDTISRGSTSAQRAGDDAEKAAAGFSQRLTASERTAAGLSSLTALEVAQLDALVERHQAAKLARTLLAPPTYLSPRSHVTPTEKKQEREIHGSFSLSYGFGSGGYSEKTGSMVLTMEDPAKGYAISIGYSESHIKGGRGYIYRDPFYDRTNGLPLDDPLRP
jgi:hypothetical protein